MAEVRRPDAFLSSYPLGAYPVLPSARPVQGICTGHRPRIRFEPPFNEAGIADSNDMRHVAVRVRSFSGDLKRFPERCLRPVGKMPIRRPDADMV